MFNKYKKNYYSQAGEDGVLLELLKRLKIKKNQLNWCCEFGAWDGVHGSNTFNLVKNFNYNAVYIEGDKNKFKDLLKTKEKYPRILAFNNYVSHKRKSFLLDTILKKTKINKDFNILSIDIDSYDLAVWKSLKHYSPKIVIIEINSSIPPGIKQIHSPLDNGNSFTSTVLYAKKNGYELICHTGNCIFIKKKYLKKLKFEKKYIKNPELLFNNSWLGKKEFFLKTFFKMILPNNFLNILRVFKKKLY